MITIMFQDYTMAIKCPWPSAAEECLTRHRTIGLGYQEHFCKHSRNVDVTWFTLHTSRAFVQISNGGIHLLVQKLNSPIYYQKSRGSGFVIFKILITVKLRPNASIRFVLSKKHFVLDFGSNPHLQFGMTGGQDLGTCFLALLDELIHCMANHNIPHYFIPEKQFDWSQTQRIYPDCSKTTQPHPTRPNQGNTRIWQTLWYFQMVYPIYCLSSMNSATMGNTLADFQLAYIESCTDKLVQVLMYNQAWTEDFSEIVDDCERLVPNYFESTLIDLCEHRGDYEHWIHAFVW